MHITILTPDREVYKGSISSVKVPGASGQFQVLNNHAPIVSALTAGLIEVVTDANQKIQWNIEKGFIEVLNNEISLLVQGVKE